MNLKENDVIFVNSFRIENLFFYLNKVNNLKNIKLITHQTDRKIDKKTFQKKPDCISQWYSINVDYEHENLIPIPLGIANDYSPKNLLINNFVDYKANGIDKELKLYINNQKNTNLKERKKTYNLFSEHKWCVIDEPNLELDEYLNMISKYNFVLCPHGNGYDTHRFWEVLYSKSIPVTKNHITYKASRGLPALFINSYSEIDLDLLKDYLLNEGRKFNREILNVNYWIEMIRNKSESNNNYYFIKQNKFIDAYFINKRKGILFIESKFKILKYYLFKVFKLIPYIISRLKNSSSK